VNAIALCMKYLEILWGIYRTATVRARAGESFSETKKLDLARYIASLPQIPHFRRRGLHITDWSKHLPQLLFWIFRDQITSRRVLVGWRQDLKPESSRHCFKYPEDCTLPIGPNICHNFCSRFSEIRSLAGIRGININASSKSSDYVEERLRHSSAREFAPMICV